MLTLKNVFPLCIAILIGSTVAPAKTAGPEMVLEPPPLV